MTIYGTALLSASVLLGLGLGRWIGALCGLDADIGGVGIAMLLLIFSTEWMQRSGRMKPPTESGIVFWSSVYIPVVVAMAATQNVRAALSGGLVAVAAGGLGVAACYALVGLLVRTTGARPDASPPPR